MDDDVARVDQNPVRTAQPFDAREAEAGILERRNEMFGGGCDMTVRTPGRDDHEVTEAGLALNVDGNDIFGLGVIET